MKSIERIVNLSLCESLTWSSPVDQLERKALAKRDLMNQRLDDSFASHRVSQTVPDQARNTYFSVPF